MSETVAGHPVEIQADSKPRTTRVPSRDDIVAARRGIDSGAEIVYQLRHTTIRRGDSASDQLDDDTTAEAASGRDVVDRPDQTPVQTPQRARATIQNIDDTSDENRSRGSLAPQDHDSDIDGTSDEDADSESFVDIDANLLGPNEVNDDLVDETDDQTDSVQNIDDVPLPAAVNVSLQTILPIAPPLQPTAPTPSETQSVVDAVDIASDHTLDNLGVERAEIPVAPPPPQRIQIYIDPATLYHVTDNGPTTDDRTENNGNVFVPAAIQNALIATQPTQFEADSDTYSVADDVVVETEILRPGDRLATQSDPGEHSVDTFEDDLINRLLALVDQRVSHPLINRLAGIFDEALNGAQEHASESSDSHIQALDGGEQTDEDEVPPPDPFVFDENENLLVTDSVLADVPAVATDTAPETDPQTVSDAVGAQSSGDADRPPPQADLQDQSSDVQISIPPKAQNLGGYLPRPPRPFIIERSKRRLLKQPQNVRAHTADGPFIVKPELYSQRPLSKPIPVSDSESEMGDGSLSPGQFHGRLDENGSEWVRQLENYCAFRCFDDARSLALMKGLLVDAAANWFESLDSKSTETYAALLASFKTRYMPPAALKFRSAKELYSRKQQPNESTDQYIDAMSKLARQLVPNVSQSEDLARFAIMNGLKPAIAGFVMQREPNSLADVIKAERIAELTSDSTADDVSSQIQKLHAKIDRMTAAASTGEQPAGNAYAGGSRPYSATPGDRRGAFINTGQTGWRRQNAYSPTPAEAYAQQGGQTYMQAYNQQYGQQQYAPRYGQQAYTQVAATEQYAPDYTQSYAQVAQQYQSTQQQQPRGGDSARRGGYNGRGGRGRGGQRPQYTDGQNACQTPGDFAQNNSEQCGKCGRRAHMNQLQCPAINRSCYICQRPGHLAAACRAAMRGRVGPSNANTTRRGGY